MINRDDPSDPPALEKGQIRFSIKKQVTLLIHHNKECWGSHEIEYTQNKSTRFQMTAEIPEIEYTQNKSTRFQMTELKYLEKTASG